VTGDQKTQKSTFDHGTPFSTTLLRVTIVTNRRDIDHIRSYLSLR